MNRAKYMVIGMGAGTSGFIGRWFRSWFQRRSWCEGVTAHGAKRRGLVVGAAFSFMGLIAVLAPAYALSDHIVVSEAVVDVTGAESAGEFVELYNPTGETVAIGGWDIAYKSPSGPSFGSVD